MIKVARIRCPHCGAVTWSTNYRQFMMDHDRPDGRACRKAEDSIRATEEKLADRIIKRFERKKP